MKRWIETTEERYDEMLDVVPPAAIWNSGLGFLVGEASDHNSRGRPRYAAFMRVNDRFFESAEPLTISEFRAVKPAEVSPCLGETKTKKASERPEPLSPIAAKISESWEKLKNAGR